MQRSTGRVACDDGCHVHSFVELFTQPSPEFRVFDLLKSKPNRLAENLSNALLSRAFGAMVRNASAKFREDKLEPLPSFLVNHATGAALISEVHTMTAISKRMTACSALNFNTYNLREGPSCFR
jgi:hypothetical protein